MTPQEFNDGWDTLISRYYPQVAFGTPNPLEFDDYEKSMFLTEAQEEILKALYKGSGVAGGFESTEEIRAYLHSMTIDNKETKSIDDTEHLMHDVDSYGYILDEDVWFLVYESVDWDTAYSGCLPSKGVPVVPVRHDEYSKLKNNPFRGANDRRVLRLDINLNESIIRTVELVSKYPIKTYNYRYIKKPLPIIVSDLTNEDLTIDGYSEAQTSQLPELLHRVILNTAVEKAIKSKQLFNTSAKG